MRVSAARVLRAAAPAAESHFGAAPIRRKVAGSSLSPPGFSSSLSMPIPGLPIASFGKSGIVDLKQGLPRVDELVKTPPGSSSPPVIVGDVVVVGVAFAAGGAPPSKVAVPGWVRAYDARTGALKWTFHTVPQAGELGADTWADKSFEYTGNTGLWTPFSADAARGYVYLPIEAATGDFYGGHRHGNDLFSDTLVCVDANTGKRIWHYQIVHHDIWDYDIPAPPVLADITVAGRKIPAVVQVTKMGLVVRLRPGDGKAGMAHRGAPRPAVGCAGREDLGDAAVSDEARTLRAAGSAARGPDRLHARDEATGARDRQSLPVRPRVHAAVGGR